MTTDLDYKPTKLEQVIKKALDENINRTCPHCERQIDYEDYGNPVEAIALAVLNYIEEIARSSELEAPLHDNPDDSN
jgi:hypothetical protein